MRLLSETNCIAWMLSAVLLAAAGPAAAATTITFETDQSGDPTVVGAEIGSTYAYLGVTFFDGYFHQCGGGCPGTFNDRLASSLSFDTHVSVVFDGLTSFVSIDNVTGSSWIADAFDGLNNYIGTISSDFAYPDTQEIQAPGGIHSIHIRASAGNLFGFDNLTFELSDPLPVAVPEPATLALLIGGLVAAGTGGRRRRR